MKTASIANHAKSPKLILRLLNGMHPRPKLLYPALARHDKIKL
jgi:hypothetical protein